MTQNVERSRVRADEDSGARGLPRLPPVQRRDIQGLRALAVGLVVLYHLWPARMPGGYVGVDVFFVISGYLITGNLLRHPPENARKLLSFWGRRVRRLLPAATLVLVVTLAASLVLLPSTTRAQVSKEVISSALYVENWALVSQATDYLATDDLHSPVQHYWSLSVEEQFYIVWPLLLMLAAWLVRRRVRLPATGLLIGAAAISSLCISYFFTASDPAASYFATPTRMWELAAGGIAALVTLRFKRPGVALATAASWTGVLLCVYAGFAYSATTPFPGLAAIVPVAGSFLVLVANADNAARSPDPLWRLRIVQLAGDASYSIYLWHWPLIVIIPVALDRPLAWPEKLVLVGAVFALSLASKHFVEDPLRRSRKLVTSMRRTYALGIACMGLVVSLGLAVWIPAKVAQASQPTLSAADLSNPASCLGAGALRNDCASPLSADLLTSPDFAAADKSKLYRDECWMERPFPTSERPVCHYGPESSSVRIALVGNSHAGHWLPAIAEGMEKYGWRVDTYLASECYAANVDVQFDGAGETEGCREWSAWATNTVTNGDYDLVIASSRTSRQIEGVPRDERNQVAAEGYASVLESWTNAGVPVLVIRDNPYPAKNAPECVSLHEFDPSECDTPQKRAVEADPLTEAARKDSTGLVAVADLTDMFCRKGTCPAVIGQVIVYRDKSHVTSTYAESLAPEVTAAIQKALER